MLDPKQDPEPAEKYDPDPKKIIPNPQHCLSELFSEVPSSALNT